MRKFTRKRIGFLLVVAFIVLVIAGASVSRNGEGSLITNDEQIDKLLSQIDVDRALDNIKV